MSIGNYLKTTKMSILIAFTLILLSACVLSGCSGGGSTGSTGGFSSGDAGGTGSVSTPTGATLTAVQVAPANPVMTVGQSIKLNITGVYSDNSQQDASFTCQCNSSNPDVVSFDDTTDIATALKSGTSTITALNPSSGISGSTIITVSNASLVSITLTPANPVMAVGQRVKLSMTGTYSDNSSQDVSSFCQCTSSNPDIVSFDDQTEFATAIKTGTATITCNDQSTGISGSAIITVGTSVVQGPEVTGVSPTVLKAGDKCTINGKGFGTKDGRYDRSLSAVFFGSTQATEYISWSDTQIIVTLPQGLSDGAITVIVQSADGWTSPLSVSFQITIASGGSSSGGGGGGGGGGGAAPVVLPDVILDWNKLTLKMITDDNIMGEFGLRTMAMLHGAMYDAVNSVEQKYTFYHVDMDAPDGTISEVAAAAAAYRILSTLYPAKTATFDELYNSELAKIPQGSSNTQGITLGYAVADNILAWRSNDNSSTAANVPCADGTLPGEWRRVGMPPVEPELPGWGLVTPFALLSGSQFRLNGPPALTSAEYAQAYNETKDLGAMNSATRTEEQTIIARFWSMGIPNHWNSIAREIAGNQGLTLIQKARLFALLNITMTDAQISCWDMKYQFKLWRPVTAIQLGDSDTNDNTTGDPMWMPLLMTPAFPEFVSAHSQVSGSAAEVLKRFFGREDFTITRMSMTSGLQPRTFSSFSAMLTEIGRSRIYGGLHFNFSDVPAQENGRQIGTYIYDNSMLPDQQ